MPTHVEPTAVVDPRAELDDEVRIGPFCVVGPKARIGRGTHLINGVTVMGRVTIGQHNRIFPGAVLGGDPQDISYRGSDTEVVIGDDNVIREGVTINRATEKEDGVTTLGSHSFIMAGCHIAHDCHVGSRVIMANATLLGGHVRVQDDATISGGVAVHHFSTIGSFSFTGGLVACCTMCLPIYWPKAILRGPAASTLWPSNATIFQPRLFERWPRLTV